MYICNHGDESWWFLLSEKTQILKVPWIAVDQVSQKTHKPNKIFSQALCVPDINLLNYSPYEGTSEHNVCYYAHPLGAGYHIVPPCTQVFQTL